MDVSPLFRHSHVLPIDSKSMLSKAIVKPGWHAICCSFNDEFPCDPDCNNAHPSAHVLEQKCAAETALSVSCCSFTFSSEILCLTAFNGLSWSMLNASSLFKPHVFEHVILSFNNLVMVAYEEIFNITFLFKDIYYNKMVWYSDK